MRVLLVGSGGREHALAWKLAQSPSLGELHAAPGSPGIARLGECHPIRAEDADGLLDLAHALEADLVVVGPEAPLVAGVADVLRRNGIPVFGPGEQAAAIEGSKSFAKEVMAAAGVATAESLAIARPPCVVKADGLAAGKGVFVCRTADELDAALRSVAALGGGVVVEELLEGPEVSLFALCDGREALALPPAQDFKRAYDGDDGPNTGGMGSYAPVPGLGREEVEELVEVGSPPRPRRAAGARDAVRRAAVRRAHADRGGASRPRVQLPLRRSRRRSRCSRCSTAICSRRLRPRRVASSRESGSDRRRARP